jgi:hypothetical protein
MPSQDPTDYSMVFTTVRFADVTAVFVRTYEMLDAAGYPDIAALLYKEYNRFREQLKQIARTVAVVAHDQIKDAELSSRVRPAPTGDPVSLNDFIGESAPLDAVPGSVGVNYEPVLEDNVDWWWTQEEGYSGHVGRQVTGFFQPGRVAPDPGQSRTHPLFQATGRGPTMTIANPIPERRFVRDGGRTAEAKWHAEVRAAEDAYVARLQNLMQRIIPRTP